MAKHNELGKRGEEIAYLQLLQQGYTIRERNWRFRKDEIDLIAEKEGKIIVVEVKTRSSDEVEDPEEAVTMKKQRFLIRAADAYITENEIRMETQFDVVTILLNLATGQFLMNHIPDAFYPTLSRK